MIKAPVQTNAHMACLICIIYFFNLRLKHRTQKRHQVFSRPDTTNICHVTIQLGQSYHQFTSARRAG